jgi:hypothetical protein
VSRGHGASKPRRGFTNTHATARLQLFEGSFFRVIHRLCADEAGILCAHLPSVLLLLRQRLRRSLFAAGNGLGNGRPGHHDQQRSNMFFEDYHLQVLSPATRFYSRRQLTHVLRGGIAAIPSLPLFHTLIFLFLQMLAAST